MKFGARCVKYFTPGAKAAGKLRAGCSSTAYMAVCAFMEDTRGNVGVKCRDISSGTAVDRPS